MILYVVGYPHSPKLPHRELHERCLFSYFLVQAGVWPWMLARKRAELRKRGKTK